MKRSIATVAAVLAVLVLGVAWHLWGPTRVPDGQPALVSLVSANFAGFQRDFNENANKVRVVVMLSPT